MKRFTITVLLALTFTGAALAKDIPFVDGPGSAKKAQTYLNSHPRFSEVKCWYAKPLVRCKGLLSENTRSEDYYRVTMSFHKTSRFKGYYFVCVQLTDVCYRHPITYSP